MKRRNFVRDCLIGIAISLVPKILQPSMIILEGDNMWCVRHTRVNDKKEFLYDKKMWVREEDADACLQAMRAESIKLL